jgi:hypothetical protein
MHADRAPHEFTAGPDGNAARLVTPGADLREVLIEHFGAPAWEPIDERYSPTVAGVYRRATAARDRALRLARHAVAAAGEDVASCRRASLDEGEPEIYADAEAFLATAVRKLREALAALRALEGVTRAADRAKFERGIDAAEIEHRARGAAAAIAAKLHGLTHVGVHAARTTTSPVAPA